ncbi:hypothetical protein BUALT_Bualt08G0041900 [Buddleja alternifolia]|uniref:Peptidase S8/S53 domain-containing protein n=1 Tax=Buddleja alternifolia TaxID=168488 RepID=A0AAV6XBK1_9LAMI|nr:hypothetical protein BUALT_Bualt08G0041900 [Buddleja alternifolia]
MDKSDMPASFDDHLQWYDSSLKSVSHSANMLYTYNNVIHGYSVQLTSAQANCSKTNQESYCDAYLPDATTPVMFIGVLDTGVWPELSSYDDKGLAQSLQAGKASVKLEPILKSRSQGTTMAMDHTITTAAGSTVVGASLFGYAAGMEKAIEDGVDVMSLSLGGSLSDYFRDTVAVGAFAATLKGIVVSCSAGNGGPSPGSLSNVAPWITTGLVNPSVYAGNVSSTSNGNLCMKGSGIGMILSNTDMFGQELVADAHFIPTAAVGQIAGDQIKKYIYSEPNPTARLHLGHSAWEFTTTPVVAAFLFQRTWDPRIGPKNERHVNFT